MNNQTQEILKVNKLYKSYALDAKRTFNVLKDISFSLYKGEICALVGLSGSGKTTLLRTLLQLDKPDSGEVFFDKKDITKLSEDQLRIGIRPNIRMVYQHPEASLNPGLNVQEILSQPYLLYNPNSKESSLIKCEEMLREMGLGKEYLHKYQHELSGGEKRRVALARALITEPQLLIADEPLAGLDKVLQYRMLKLLFSLKRSHDLTVFLVSHDVDIMIEICDRILVLHDGKIVEEAVRDGNSIRFNNEYSKSLYTC